MMLSIFELLKDKEKIRVKIDDKFREKLLANFNSDKIKEVSSKLKIHPKTLERKLKGIKGYSFLLKELEIISSALSISRSDIFKNILMIKLAPTAKWVSLPKFEINEEFVKGIGYYIGDGRMKTSRSISTSNTEKFVLRFFLRWLIKYFRAGVEDLKIKIYVPTSDFDEDEIKKDWIKKLNISSRNILKVKFKNGIDLPFAEIWYNRTILKLLLDKIIPIVKKACLDNQNLAAAYLKGILAAEGSVKYNEKSSSRSVQIKMKSYDEILFIITLLITFLKCRPSLSPSYSDDEWVVVISGRDDLEKIMKINGFELHPERKRKLNTILSTYKRKQVKKGDVYLTYLKLLLNLQSKKFDGVTIKDLTKTIDRDRTRIAAIFKMFYEKGLVNRRRLNGSGRPYCYTITEDGIKLINKLSSSPQI